MRENKIRNYEEIKKTLGKVFATIIKKQFDIIGEDITKFDFTVDGWYSKYSWTEKQQNRFKDWFITYLYRHIKRVREIVITPNLTYRSKKRLEQLWCEWNLLYGWRLNETECRQDPKEAA